MNRGVVRIADLFCGAGGSSSGAKRALARRGLRMDLVAVNHWNIAVETHAKNHPEARHVCVDLFRTRPLDVVPEGKLDLLMASPTCTFHSRARGGKPISHEQKYGRMTPTQVIRWVTDLDVKTLLVENVPEFVEWGPVHMHEPAHPACVAARCRGERPCRRRAGCYFRSWVRRLEARGYRVEWRVLNAADFGGATTRQRFFLLARKDGRPIGWPPPTHAKGGGKGDLFSGPVKPWRGAREVIEWSISGRSIFGRKRPLSPKTLARIYAGARKFKWPEPFLVILRNHMDGQSLEEPLPTVCAGGTHLGLATPMVFQVNQGGDRMRNLRSVEEPLQTVVTRPSLGLAEPLVVPQGGGGAARPVSQPMATIATDGAHALIAPYYGAGSGLSASSVATPLPTVTTRDRFGLVMPVTHDDTSARARSLEDPLPTVTGARRGDLALITTAFGEQAPRVHDIGAPLPTICATGSVNLVEGRTEPVYDILFRMLTPRELARAMGFSDAEVEYEFVGTKTEITKQIGNAVSVEQAEALVGAIFDTVAARGGLVA